ncbi:hypothetical protein IAU60_004828 [Kwoniella sp. DSM 27419]
MATIPPPPAPASGPSQASTYSALRRTRSTSLSIARSPSVLSSGLFLTPSHQSHSSLSIDPAFYPGYNLDDAELHPQTLAHHPYTGHAHALRRVISGPSGTLDTIDSVEELIDPDDEVHSAPDLHRPHESFTSSTGEAPGYKGKQTFGRAETPEVEDDEGDHHPSRPLLSRKISSQTKHVSFSSPHSPLSSIAPFAPAYGQSTASSPIGQPSSRLRNQDYELDLEYDGPFQPPDSKELTGIILSCVGVLILAVAAGCTTIFDWVL